MYRNSQVVTSFRCACKSFVIASSVAASLNVTEVKLIHNSAPRGHKRKQSKIAAPSGSVRSLPPLRLGFVYHFPFFAASASNLCIPGWRFLSQELVTGICSIVQVESLCNSKGGSFRRFCRSLFQKFLLARSLWMLAQAL